MGRYIRIPYYVFDDDLSPYDFMVYCYLSSCADQNTRTCYPSRKTIAEHCKIKSLTTVDKSIKKLIERNFITKTKRYDEDNNTNASNLYYIC